MNLYLTRHGETDWNVENRVQGRTDIPLNANGLAQAQALADKIREENIHLDIIYSSPLERAYVTAQKCAEAAGCEAVPLDELIEMNFGEFEGATRDNRDYQEAKKKFFTRYPGGESYMDVAARIYPLLKTIKNGPYDDVMLVAHNGIARIVNSYFYDMGTTECRKFTIGNCEIRKYEL